MTLNTMFSVLNSYWRNLMMIFINEKQKQFNLFEGRWVLNGGSLRAPFFSKHIYFHQFQIKFSFKSRYTCYIINPRAFY